MARKRREIQQAAIDAIEPVPGKPTHRRIIVTGESVATLADYEVDELKLRVGMFWTPALAARIDEAIALAKARAKALSILGRRPSTRGEIVARLSKAKFDDRVAQMVAEELVEQGWINEAQIATDSARAMSRRTVDVEAITERLKSRRVAEDAAEVAAAQAVAQVDRIAMAASYVRQKLAGKRGKPGERDIRRIMAGLARKGFDAEDAASAFRRHGIEVDDFLDRL